MKTINLWLNERDNLFILFHSLFGLNIFIIWSIYYIHLNYMHGNVFWAGYTDWIGVIFSWMGLR